jgi:hypothetical protein
MKKLVIFCLLLLVSLCAYAQTAQQMDTVLETSEVSWAQAAYFVLPAAGVLDENVPMQEAFETAKTQHWLPQKSKFDDTAHIDGVSLLIMRSFKMKGGLMYTMFHTARYAYRELIYEDLIINKGSPSATISGEELLYMLGRILNRTEGAL